MHAQFFHDDDLTFRFATPCCAHAAGIVARRPGRVCRRVSPCIRKWKTSSDAVPAAAYWHLCRAVDDGEGARFSAMCALHGFERRVQLWHGHRFQPDNGKCLFCGGGHQIVAGVAFCWREPHADIYTARSPTNRAGGENATTPVGSRPLDRISWNPSARQGVLSIRHWAVRRKEKLLCQY